MEVLFSVDRGGTFTDVFAEIRNGNQREEKVLKLLSEDPGKSVIRVIWEKSND